jgi:hypothetical protein
VGPSGIGKTVFANLLLRESPFEVRETDIIEVEHIDVPDNVGLIIDAVESPAVAETSGITAFARKRSAPTVVVCHENKKARSRTCETVVLLTPNPDDIADDLTQMLSIDRDIIREVARRSKGDMRHVFMDLEDLLLRKKLWGERDEFWDGSAALKRLFEIARKGPWDDARAVAGVGDGYALAFENYLSTKASMFDTAKAADWMSIGDAVDHILYSKQWWELHEFRIVAGCHAPAICVGPLSCAVKAATQRGRMSGRKVKFPDYAMYESRSILHTGDFAITVR